MTFETKVFLVAGIFWSCVALRILRWFVNSRRPKLPPSKWEKTIGPLETKNGQLHLAQSPAIRGNLKRPRLPARKDWSSIPSTEEIYGHPRRS